MSSQATRSLGLTAAALAVEWTSQTLRFAPIQLRTSTNTTTFFGAGRSIRPKQLESRVYGTYLGG